MAEKKKQHYVPKFYLKFFSVEGDKTHIKIFNKSRAKTINKGTIKGQAQEDYYYGKDLSLENWFGEIETECAIIFNEIIASKTLPKKNSKEHQYTWLFMLLQAYRTPAQVKEINEMTDSMVKSIIKHDKEFQKFDINSFKIGINDAPLRNIKTLIEGLPMMTDLELKLIVNRTDIPFITSDNPAFKYNQFLESRNFKYGKTGMGCKGLQIFYPVSPDLMLIFYDPKIYKTGNKKQFSDVAATSKDVDELNLLIFLYAQQTVYSNEKVNNFYFERLYEKAKKYQDLGTVRMKEYKNFKSEHSETGESILVHHHREVIETGLQLSFSKQTPFSKYYKLNGTAAELREFASHFKWKRDQEKDN